MAAKDRELQAISAIIDVLKPLKGEEKSRVIEYVLDRFELGAVHSAANIAIGTSQPDPAPFASSAHRRIADIRSLTAEKQPRTANEMVALIAYYLSELASEAERSPTINVERVRKYFKMAAFPMPRVPSSALTNAAAAGYLESVSRGEYELNPVGYNLIVHGLPRSAEKANTGVRRNRKTKKKVRSKRK